MNISHRRFFIVLFGILLLVIPVTLVAAWTNSQCYNLNPSDNIVCDTVVDGVTNNLISTYPPGIAESGTHANKPLEYLDVRIRAWDYNRCTVVDTRVDSCQSVIGSGVASCEMVYTNFSTIPPGTDYYTSRHKWRHYTFGPANLFAAIEQFYATRSFWRGDAVQDTCVGPQFIPDDDE